MTTVVDELPAALRGEQAGRTHVDDVKVKLDQDSAGLLALFIILVLSSPKVRQKTWPSDDLWTLRQKVRQKIEESWPNLEYPWYVAFEPKDREELDPEDASEAIETEQ